MFSTCWGIWGALQNLVENSVAEDGKNLKYLNFWLQCHLLLPLPAFLAGLIRFYRTHPLEWHPVYRLPSAWLHLNAALLIEHLCSVTVELCSIRHNWNSCHVVANYLIHQLATERLLFSLSVFHWIWCGTWTSSVFLKVLMRVSTLNLVPDVRTSVYVCFCHILCVHALHLMWVTLWVWGAQTKNGFKFQISFLLKVFLCVCIYVCVWERGSLKLASVLTDVPNWANFDINLTQQQRFDKSHQKKKKKKSIWEFF